MKYIHFIFILFVFALFSCADDVEVAIIIEGITERDAVAANSGTIDLTDWNSHDTWSSAELALFEEYADKNLNNDGIAQHAGISSYYGYPNPATTTLNVAFSPIQVFDEASQTTTSYEEIEFGMYKVLDANLNVVAEQEITDPAIHWLYELDDVETPFATAGLYRFYYVLKYKDIDYVFKGHGDFEVVK